MTARENSAAQDSGLLSLVAMARLHQVAADPAQLIHQFGHSGEKFDDASLLQAAKWLGLKARRIESTFPRLADTPLPAIARLDDGSYLIIAGVRDGRVLLKRSGQQSPELVSCGEFEGLWSGTLIVLTRRTQPGPGFRSFDFSWFVPFILKYRVYLGEVLLASFFLQLFALVTPLFFQVVIDKVLVHRGLTTLHILGIGLLVVSVFEVVLGGLRTYVFAHTTNRIDVALGRDLFKHLLRLPIAYFETRRVGDTVARVRELETIRNFITGSSITVLVDAFFTLVFFAVMYAYSPLLTLVVAATIPFYGLLAFLVTPVLRERLNEKFNRGADNQAYLVEAIAGMQTLKAAAVEPVTQRRWEERLAAYVSASFNASVWSNVANQSAAFINKLMVLGILWIGAHLAMTGALSVGQLVAFNMFAARISGPLLRLVQMWQDFQQAGVSVQRLGDILNTFPEPAHSPSRSSLPRMIGGVRFEHVTFRYRPDGPEVLADLSFGVSPGSIVGIVGRSGSGKSTLTNLIQRLYVPERGRVLVDGVDLAMVDTTWLRRNIGVVLQENVLFNCSVRENIALADPAIPMQRVVRAAELAGADQFIIEMTDGYDTIVGEHGANLSGGQRQRIAIARALIGDPRILLLDEATSALDYESEAAVQSNMRRICDGRTVFIVAHRLSAVRMADRLLVIDKGRVVEAGTHSELVRRSGYYARLFHHQSAAAAFDNGSV